MSFDLLLTDINETTRVVDPALEKYIYAYLGSSEEICGRILYSINELGLRIRPFLVRMGYQAGGGNYKSIVPVAAAVELMQIATLVTDDILDDAQTRNRKETVAKKYGHNTAILVGELLKSIASQVFLKAIEENRDYQRANEALALFEKTYSQICIGQYLDLEYQNKDDVSESQYLEMIEKTTGRFIQASIEIGSLLSSAQRKTVICLSNYGLNLGYAYQIRDDVIDVIGDEKYTGKPFAGDIKQKKKRLPLLYALAELPDSSCQILRDLLGKSSLGERELETISNILKDSGAVEYCKNMTKIFCERAIQELAHFENEHGKIVLTDLALLVSHFEN